MKWLFGFSISFLSLFAHANTACEELIKKIDPKASAKSPIVTIGQLKFNFLSPSPNPASSCSMTVSHVNQKRRSVFMDDGSMVIATEVGIEGKSSDVKVQSYLFLPQEKGKNFTVSRDGNIVTLKMNAGDFTFDTNSGKMISNSTISVQDTPGGVSLTQPQGLLVHLGTGRENPREKAGMATLNHRSASCQFDKAKLIEGIGDKKNYDKNIRFRTSASQIDFVKKSCPGTKLQISAMASAPDGERREKGVLSPDFIKFVEGLQ